MHHSLDKLSKLPKESEVYCAHEYTVSNLMFAISLMPNNQALQTYLKECIAKREKGEITLPSNLKRELEINPFLRTHDQNLIKSLTSKFKNLAPDAVSIFTATRQAKDQF
jgi:hydroxyacylglutathione hydrolase